MSSVVYNFVLNCLDSELEYFRNLEVESHSNIFSRYDLEWCLQTYLILKRGGNMPVHCDNKLVAGAVNIVHSAQLLNIKGSVSDFIVCIQADFAHRVWAHYHILQNYSQKYSNSSVVPLWIQPGLIKRDPSRAGVERVAYAGQISRNFAGSEAMWRDLFAPHKIEFVILPSGACFDMHDIDVLIALRSFDTKSHDKKPPSKLINAWHSEIPFIGGYDSAYMQVGEPGVDYLLAKSPEEVLAAVLRLKRDGSLYNSLVKNGKHKAPLYTTETIAAKWEEILMGPVNLLYRKWLTTPQAIKKARFNALLTLGLAQNRIKSSIKKALGIK